MTGRVGGSSSLIFEAAATDGLGLWLGKVPLLSQSPIFCNPPGAEVFITVVIVQGHSPRTMTVDSNNFQGNGITGSNFHFCPPSGTAL